MNEEVQLIGGLIVDAIRNTFPRAILQDHEFERCCQVARTYMPDKQKALAAVMAELRRIKPFEAPYATEKKKTAKV